jgi:hypothetical protein
MKIQIILIVLWLVIATLLIIKKPVIIARLKKIRDKK